MITEQSIRDLALEKLQEFEHLFLVDVKVSAAKNIEVSVDGMKPVTIENCVAISRHIEGNLDREQEDFQLTVSSAGMGVPFKVWQQYVKNTGREVEVVQSNGEKIEGVLEKAEDNTVTIRLPEKKKKKKKGEAEDLSPATVSLGLNEIKEIKTVIKFK
jgi:ribosome maturation factor RimP